MNKSILGNKLAQTYLECADYVVSAGLRKSDMAEVQNLFCSVSLSDDDCEDFSILVDRLAKAPELQHGFKKAQRAYQRVEGNITKPSYIGRIIAFPFLKFGTNDRSPLDQIQIVTEKFAEAPQASNLAISVFHPSDLRDAYRPGYVPCLSFIDIKFRAGKLETKFYFRSCDFAEVAIFDFYHCMRLHFQLKSGFQKARPDVDMNSDQISWFFSRAFTYNRKREPISVIRSFVHGYAESNIDPN